VNGQPESCERTCGPEKYAFHVRFSLVAVMRTFLYGFAQEKHTKRYFCGVTPVLTPKERRSKPLKNNSFAEYLMGMSDDVWSRHTNPQSGWSRLSIPPLFALAVWSRDWIGWWSLMAIALVCVWTWANPRVFRRPGNLESWMSKAVLGERLWLDRNRPPRHGHHRTVPLLVAGASGIGLLPLAWGLWQLEVWPTLTGLILIMGGKLWFLDRMVWLVSDSNERSIEAVVQASRSMGENGLQAAVRKRRRTLIPTPDTTKKARPLRTAPFNLEPPAISSCSTCRTRPGGACAQTCRSLPT
jgi:hypothetical protein